MNAIKGLIKKSPRLTRYARDVQLTFFRRRLEKELQLLPLLVDSRKTAIDVGANTGVYTHALTKLTSSVLAVEPNEELARQLTQTYGKRAVVRNVALSDQRGEAELRMPKTGKYRTGLATIDPANQLGNVELTTQKVAILTLDDLVSDFGSVGFVKIDVEGHELAVLRGGVRMLEAHRPTLLIEAENRHRERAVETMFEFLTAKGYIGFMLDAGRLVSASLFDARVHQSLAHQSSANLNAGIITHTYINNFVFFPT